MSDVATPALDGLDLERLLELRRERRRIDAEIAALVTPLDATTTPVWGPCTRCGHVWRGKSADKPGHCAGCSSAYWDRERSRKRAEGRAVRKKRSRSRRPRAGLPKFPATPYPRPATIREVMAGPPPPTMTPPPAAALSIVRPTPPPMWTPPAEEPQPEAVASPLPPPSSFDEITNATLDAVLPQMLTDAGMPLREGVIPSEALAAKEDDADVPHERDPS